MARLFISQERMDRWASQEKVSLDGDRMRLPVFGTSFRIIPAVYFVRAIAPAGAEGRTGGGDRAADGEESDPAGLVGRVKTEAQLKEMGAEVVANSVILGDRAYECENGFVGEILDAGSESALRKAQQQPAPNA